MCEVLATNANTPFTPMFNGTPQLRSRTDNYTYITPAGKVIGRPLDAHWTPIGDPLDPHWTRIGHPLDTEKTQ